MYRQKAPRHLTNKQQKDKLKRDSEYEIAHLNLSAEYKRGKLTKEEFDALHAKQWKDYEDWAIANGFYEEVTPEQELAEAEAALDMQIKQVNAMRAELNKPLLKVKE